MSNNGKCPECGAAMAANAPAGLCPNCLMALNLKTETMFSDDAAPTAQPPLPPEQIAPHFPQLEILELLGRGGMGVVYKARQKTLNRFVALKLMAPERVGDPKFAERFAREAQALAALNHPNIVTIHDFGQAGGFYFLLMEFVDGANLRHLLRAQKFTPEEALAIVPPLCEALQYAHERGIVHRDIKPENLLLDRTGRVKIADFGIAKMLGTVDNGAAGSPPVTEDATTQSALGTRGYCAPEQQNPPQRVDNRADIYSLGVVLYEMLTGELPGKTIEAPSKKVQIDVRLDAVVLRALEKMPELRWQTAAEMRTQVETIAQTTGAPEKAEKPDSADEEKPRLRHGLEIGVGLMALGILSSVVFFLVGIHMPVGTTRVTPGMVVSQTINRLFILAAVLASVGVFLCIVLTWLFGPTRNDTALARVQEWLALMDKGDYAGAWETAAKRFKRAVTKNEWMDRGQITCKPLGQVISRKVRTSGCFGPRFTVKFDTVFTGLKSAVETVTFKRELDGQWRAIGYLILPAYADKSRVGRMAWEGMFFSCVGALACIGFFVRHSSGMAPPDYLVICGIPLAALLGMSCGGKAKERRLGRIAMWLGLLTLPVWLVMLAFMQLSVGANSPVNLADSPQLIRNLSTTKVIEVGLSKPLSPWAWQELERRPLTTNDASQIMDGVTAWLQREYPEGKAEPVNWLDNFLDDLAGKGLVTDDQKIHFLVALNGELRGDPLSRLREGDDHLDLYMQCRYIWRNDLLGMEMMNEVESATVDGQPLKETFSYGKNWEMQDVTGRCELPKLSPGPHQFKLKVLSALVAKDDLTGLAHDAPSADWPPAKKRWERTAVRELTIYPHNAVIVSLTENPALDPIQSASINVTHAIIRSKGDQAEAALDFDISNNLPVDISFDVALRFAGQTIPCGQLWATKNREGQISTGQTELTADVARFGPEVREADIVLTPNPKPVENIGTVDHIWGAQIVLKGIALKRLDLNTGQP